MRKHFLGVTIFVLSLFVLSESANAQAFCYRGQRAAKPDAMQTAQMESAIFAVFHSGIAEDFKANNRPGWVEYDALAKLKKYVESNPQVTGHGMIEKLSVDLQKQISLVQNQIQDILSAHRQFPETAEALRFVRYLDNHYAFFRLQKEINDKLGVALFPLPDFSRVMSDEQARKAGVEFVSRLEGYAEKTFADTGFKDLKAYEEKARQVNPKNVRFLDLIQHDLVIGMHRPENARFWIPIAGFQNQRVTGSSKGCFCSTVDGKADSRDRAEANLSNMPVADYANLSARLKPNYAEARPQASVQDMRPNLGASGYGPDLWIMKQKAVSRRATWTPLDSLWPGNQMSPAPHINNNFVPWKYRALMASYLHPEAGLISPNYSQQTGMELKLVGQKGAGGYFEVQIFGALTLDDVQAFHFQGTPPSRELYDLLISKGIKVWDERTWPAKPYNGEESH